MSRSRKLRDRWRRAQRGWPERYPVAQFPNPPLLVAIGAWIVGATTRGSVRPYARAAFFAGLAAWAYEEMASGVNAARRVYGAGGLAYVVVKIRAALLR